MASLIDLYDSKNMSDVVLARIARCAFNYYKGKDEGLPWGQYGFPAIMQLLEQGHDFTDRESQQNKIARNNCTSDRFFVRGVDNPAFLDILVWSIQKVLKEAGRYGKANIEMGGIFPFRDFGEVIKEPLGYEVILTMGRDRDFGGEPIIKFDYKESDRPGVRISYPDGRKKEVESYSNWKYPKAKENISLNIQSLERKLASAKSFGHPYQNTYQEYLRYLKSNATAITWHGYEYSKFNIIDSGRIDCSCDIIITLDRILDIQIPA